MNKENIAARCPDLYNGNVKNFFADVTDPNSLDAETMRRIHSQIVFCVSNEIPHFIARNFSGYPKSAPHEANDGTRFYCGDNALAVWLYGSLLGRRLPIAWSLHEAVATKSLPLCDSRSVNGLHWRKIAHDPLGLYNARWKLSHVFKCGVIDSNKVPVNSVTLTARFVRLAHPINHFLSPKPFNRKTGGFKFHGESDPAESNDICQWIWAQRKSLYPDICDWFEDVALIAESERSNAAPDGRSLEFSWHQRVNPTQEETAPATNTAQPTSLISPVTKTTNDLFSVSTLSPEEKGATWTLNDSDAKKHYFRNIPYPHSHRFYSILLSFRTSASDKVQFIGIFKVDIEEMVRNGILKTTPDGQSVKVAVWHEGEDFVLKSSKTNDGVRLVRLSNAS